MNFCFVFGHEPWLLPPALEMMDVLRANGHSVSVVYAEYQGSKPTSGDYDTAHTYGIAKAGGRVRHIFRHLYLRAIVQRLLKQKKVDVLIATDILPLQAITDIHTKAKKGYWCFEMHDHRKRLVSMDFYRQKNERKWIGNMDFLLMPTESRRDSIFKNLKLSLPDEVIYNCKKYEPRRNITTHSAYPQYTHLLVYAGMISSAQFIKEIVEAMQDVPEGAGLVLAGPANGGYLDEVLQLIENNVMLKERVHYLGRITRDEVYRLVDMADMGFVLYGKDDNGNDIDPAPNKLGDNIAGQTWTIGTAQPYLRHWLDEKGAGISVKDINRHTLAQAITTIMTHEAFKDKQVLQTIYATEFNMNKQYDKLMKLLQRI